MSIDYYNCDLCGEIFPDVIEYGYCTNCEEILCKKCKYEQIEKYGLVEEGTEMADYYGENNPAKCDLCSGEVVRDIDIIQWFIKNTGITREDIVKFIKEDIGVTIEFETA